MVNAGRICCIAAPFLLTLAVLICMTLLFLAGTFKRNHLVDDLYFLKIDLTNLTLDTSASSSILAGNANNSTLLAGALQAAKQSLGMKDFYTIYLRSSCSWNGNDVYANCTEPKAYWWFNPIKVWGLNKTGTPVDDFLPKTFTDGLDTYHAAVKGLFYLYVGALSASAITLLVGISAAFSRWGSFVTSFCASAMAILIIAASALASAIYLILRTALNETLRKEYGIKSTIGNHVFALTWIATAFAVGAGFFWTLSVCCCSGRSPYNPGSKEARRTRAEKTPYTYERVGSPYMGPSDHQSVPLNTLGPQGYAPTRPAQTGSAYEPFRPHV